MSQMVKELILDNDTVTLPGLGAFVAEIVPATFSDRGYTINPPYRKLYFRENVGEDDLLVKLYASSNNVSEEVANNVLTEFLSDMKNVLNSRKVIVFPELGRLRATRENNYFFVPFEDTDIYPAGFGLQPISLKAHNNTGEEFVLDVPAEVEQNEGAEENVDKNTEENDAKNVEENVEENTNTEEITEEETVEKTDDAGESESAVNQEIVPVEETEKPAEVEQKQEPAEQEQPEPAGKMSKKLKITLITIISVVALAVVALLIFILLSRIAPDFTDSLLYTKEELEILGR